MVAAPGRTTIALDGGAVLGTANMYANRSGPGAHVASASFIVASAARGRGVGRALVEDALRPGGRVQIDAIQRGCRDECGGGRAVWLGRVLDRRTVPEAFDRPEHGLVGLHVMYLKLR